MAGYRGNIGETAQGAEEERSVKRVACRAWDPVQQELDSTAMQSVSSTARLVRRIQQGA